MTTKPTDNLAVTGDAANAINEAHRRLNIAKGNLANAVLRVDELKTVTLQAQKELGDEVNKSASTVGIDIQTAPAGQWSFNLDSLTFTSSGLPVGSVASPKISGKKATPFGKGKKKAR
jgi:hypothetical protein